MITMIHYAAAPDAIRGSISLEALEGWSSRSVQSDAVAELEAGESVSVEWLDDFHRCDFAVEWLRLTGCMPAI